jgi:hypothetical protein
MKRIRNFTAHKINFYFREDVNFVSNIRKFVARPDTKPYISIPSEGMLSLTFDDEKIGDEPVPTYKRLISKMDRIPELEEGDMLVVSAAFASMRKVMDSSPYPLYTVKDVVYDGNTRPIGCLGLIEC